MSPLPFTRHVIELIRAIPHGKVASYGVIAAMAGSPRAARQVVRILHSCSHTEDLPWHRVINKEGRISLPEMQGGARQKELLEAEGVAFDDSGRVDMNRHRWSPDGETPSS